MKFSTAKEKRKRRHKRVRARVWGTATRPRLSIFRSNKHIWAQLIDDEAGKTILSASDKTIKTKGKRTVAAGHVGENIAKSAAEKKIKSVVFDRGGYRYHGIVRALADGARKGGLKF